MSYSQHASAYSKQGLQVIPLYPFSRVPNLRGAKQFSTNKVSKEQIKSWSEHHPKFNIGCVTGEASGVCFLRVNRARPQIQGVLAEIFGESHWTMVDGDYLVSAYLHRDDLKSFAIFQHGESEPLLELVANGGVQILPPSTPTLQSSELVANREMNGRLLTGLPEQFEDTVSGALSSLGLKLEAKPPAVDDYKVPAGIRAYKLSATGHRLTTDTLNGTRTLQESIDLFHSVGDMVSATQDEIDHAIYEYFQWIKDDMLLLGKSLPKTWDMGYNGEYDHGFTKFDTEWDYMAIKQYVYEQISANFHNDDAKLEAVQETLRRMNQAQTIDIVQEDQLLRYIAKQANLGLSVGILRRQLKHLNTGTCPGENQTEIAQAYLTYVTRFAPLVLANEMLYRFTGAHWEKVRDQEVTQEISRVFGHLPSARRANDHYGILRIAKSGIEAPLKHPKYENLDGINFSNGFLDSELVLHEHHPDFGATYMMPFEYDADMAAASNRPMFNQFLEDCWGNDDDYTEKKQALREAIAITLLGNAYKYQKVFLLFGAPKSGKSQLLNIVSSLVPINAKTSLPPTEWGERFRPAQLHNKILNIAGELSEHRLIEGQIFKDIVDGTEQLAENKGTNFFRFIPKCAHWFASNHFPKTKDTSEGFIRRWQIFTFKRPIPDGAAIVRDLGYFIAAKERQSIVAWALTSLPALQQCGEYTAPASHLEALSDVAGINNSVRFFMTGSGLIHVANPSLKNSIQHIPAEQLKSLGYLTGDVLHTVYSSFVLGVGGVRPVSSLRFHQMMEELCPMFGILKRRVQHQNGSTTFAYFNLAITKEPTAETQISMASLIGSDSTDSNDGSTKKEKYQ